MHIFNLRDFLEGDEYNPKSYNNKQCVEADLNVNEVEFRNVSFKYPNSSNYVLKKSGVWEKIKSLNKGIDTSVYKLFDKEGVEFSGVESQKICISRACYKNSSIIILDEPTSALDPYSEMEIFT